MAKKKVDENKKRRSKKSVPPAVRVLVNASYNNTIVSVVDYDGNVLVNTSCGSIGFTGSRKSTAYAATKAGQEAAEQVKERGARECEVIVKGIGIGRQSAIKGVRQAGLKIISLADHTPVPHGGTKPRRQPKK